jgi:hypothetical protein
MKKSILITMLTLVTILEGKSNMSDNYDNIVEKAKVQLEEKLASVGAEAFFQIQFGVDTSAVKSFLKDKQPQIVHLIYKSSNNEEYLVIFTHTAEKIGILLNKKLEMITGGNSTNCQFIYLSPAFKFDDAALQATFGGIPRYLEVHLLNDYIFRSELIFIREQNAVNKTLWRNYKNDKIFENFRSYKEEIKIKMNSNQPIFRNS